MFLDAFTHSCSRWMRIRMRSRVSVAWKYFSVCLASSKINNLHTMLEQLYFLGFQLNLLHCSSILFQFLVHLLLLKFVMNKYDSCALCSLRTASSLSSSEKWGGIWHNEGQQQQQQTFVYACSHGKCTDVVCELTLWIPKKGLYQLYQYLSFIIRVSCHHVAN